MIITAYILSVIVAFVVFIKMSKNKFDYIDKEDLFCITFASIWWPLILFGFLVYTISDFIERVVNKP